MFYEFLYDIITKHGFYIGLAIVYGVNKAVDRIETKDEKFTVSNILKYSIVYSILAPLKMSKDINTLAKNRREKNRKKD